MPRWRDKEWMETAMNDDWLQIREASNLIQQTLYDILEDWGITTRELEGLDPLVRCEVCGAREIGCTGLILHRIGCPAPNWRIEKIEPRVIYYAT